jgi:hypothetical protein
MNLDLTDEEREALTRHLRTTIEGDRYFLSERIKRLQSILDKLEPPKPRAPLPEPAYSDDVGRAFRLMSATHSDRSRPAVPIDVGRGGGAPAGRM